MNMQEILDMIMRMIENKNPDLAFQMLNQYGWVDDEKVFTRVLELFLEGKDDELRVYLEEHAPDVLKPQPEPKEIPDLDLESLLTDDPLNLGL